jgi:glutathione S-transferase
LNALKAPQLGALHGYSDLVSEDTMLSQLSQMKLLYQTHSPYARKALVFAHEAGIAHRIEVIHHETSPTLRNDEVYAHNPLGKVPILVRSDAPPIFDSDVICAYLDTLHNRSPLIPSEGEPRWASLRLQAVAQGLCDSGIALRWELVRRPPPFRYEPLKHGYTAKLLSTYDWLAREIEMAPEAPTTIGHIAVATALSWLEFRGLPNFRDGRQKLADWMAAFEARPSMRETSYSD